MTWGTYFECDLCDATYKIPEKRVNEEFIPEGWAQISWQRKGKNGTWKKEVFLVCGEGCAQSVLELKKQNKIRYKD